MVRPGAAWISVIGAIAAIEACSTRQVGEAAGVSGMTPSAGASAMISPSSGAPPPFFAPFERGADDRAPPSSTGTSSNEPTNAGARTNRGDDGEQLAPLVAEGELVRLAVSGFRDAVVSVPLGATGPRPIVLALHGNFDRPEWQCEVWRGVTRGKAFVVCPRGIPRPDAPRTLDRWTYGKGSEVRAEVEAALGAVRARFDGYVASGPILYAGFSLGAIHGVGIVASDGQRYPRVVLVEGGHDGWTAARARAYARAGGKRVLFACGQRACKSEAAQARKNLNREGVETELVYGGEVGHTYDGPVASEIARVWAWLVAGDPLWTDG